jgi:hypothetical protein
MSPFSLFGWNAISLCPPYFIAINTPDLGGTILDEIPRSCFHFDATLERSYRVTARIVRHDLRFDRLVLDTGATERAAVSRQPDAGRHHHPAVPESSTNRVRLCSYSIS